MKDVIVLYKNLGETPRECVERFKESQWEKHPEYAKKYTDVPMTYAGRLDPMAEGLLLVLSGEAIAEKETYTSLSKTYEFDMLWGASTDTVDILGILLDGENFQKNDTQQKVTSVLEEVPMPTLPAPAALPAYPEVPTLKKILQKSVGKFEQKYPAYSSRTVTGVDVTGASVTKSLIEWSRAGELARVDIPSHKVELMSAEFVSRRFVSGAEILKNIEEKIALVRGDFRQEKILARWREILTPVSETQFALDRVRISVSGGFYVRQFVSDVARDFGTLSSTSAPTFATTYHISRTRIGDFHNPTDLH